VLCTWLLFTYALPFFKNGADLTVYVITSVCTCLLIKGVFITPLLNHGVRRLQGIYFFISAQVASVGCMCSVIVYFLHCICVCDCDGRHESLIMLSYSVMVRRSHLLARCYLGTMCMCTTATCILTCINCAPPPHMLSYLLPHILPT
jgi:hypothetical protein